MKRDTGALLTMVITTGLVLGMLLMPGCGSKPAKEQTWRFDQASQFEFDPEVVTVDAAGAQLKRLPDGEFWTAVYQDPRPRTGPEYHDLDFAPDGSIVAVGDCAGFASNTSEVIVGKYDAAGNLLPGWPRFYAGGGRHWNEGQRVAVDRDGNINISGYALVYRLDPGGNILPGWPQGFLGERSISNGIIVDRDGNIVVCGSSDTDVYDRVYIAKYNPDGSQVPGWPKAYEVPGSSANFSYDLIQDADGNLVMTGYTVTSGDRSAALFKIDGEGTLLAGWPVVWDSGTGNDEYFSVSQDTGGDYCIVGLTQGTTEDDGKLLVTRYSREGQQLTSAGWPRVYEQEGLRDASPPDAWGGEVDASGNIAAAMTSSPEGQVQTVRYTPGGSMSAGYPREYGQPGYRDVTRGCRVDAQGNVYVVGFSELVTGGFDYTTFIVKYAPGAYSTGMPSVMAEKVLEYKELCGFSEQLGEGSQGNVGYLLSPEGTHWYCYDGTAWVEAIESSQANPASVLNVAIASFADEFGAGPLCVMAILDSDGTQTPVLESVTVTYR